MGLFVDIKKVRTDAIYNIRSEFGIPMKLIKLYLNESCSTVRLGKHLSDMFPIKNNLKQEGASSQLVSPLLENIPIFSQIFDECIIYDR